MTFQCVNGLNKASGILDSCSVLTLIYPNFTHQPRQVNGKTKRFNFVTIVTVFSPIQTSSVVKLSGETA